MFSNGGVGVLPHAWQPSAPSFVALPNNGRGTLNQANGLDRISETDAVVMAAISEQVIEPESAPSDTRHCGALLFAPGTLQGAPQSRWGGPQRHHTQRKAWLSANEGGGVSRKYGLPFSYHDRRSLYACNTKNLCDHRRNLNSLNGVQRAQSAPSPVSWCTPRI